MTDTVFLNGQFLPLSEAKISVLDRGFIFGDGVYELIPAYSRVLFRLQEHLARLQYSLSNIRLANPYTDGQWSELLRAVVAKNPWQDQAVYLQVTRGVAKRDQAFPAPPVAPTVLIMSSEMRNPSAEQRRDGVAVITREDFRWLRCDIKTTSLLANCMLRQESVDAGCVEVVLLRDGRVTEASTSNVFIVKNGVLITPPKDNLILPGITYDFVIELARSHDLPFEVRPVTLAELYAADEVLLSSSVREVLPVSIIDGMPVSSGKPGPIFARLYQLYQEYKSTLIKQTAHG